MTNIKDYTRYKKSKIIAEDLLEVVAILNNTIKQLEPYTKYKYIGTCIRMLHDSEVYLNVHLKRHVKVVEQKGNTDGVE